MIIALRDDVIVRRIFEPHRGLIVIPKSATKFKQYDGEVYGEVVSVGPKFKYDVKPGDKINFQRHEGNKFIYNGETYLRLKTRHKNNLGWIMAKVEG